METKTIEFNGETLKVHPNTELIMFKELSDEEKADWRESAKRDDFQEARAVFHPIFQDAIIKKLNS